MQPTTRTIYKRIPRTLRTCPTISNNNNITTAHTHKVIRPISTTTNKMSFFPRSYFAPEASFTPLFRLLDDFDNYSREVSSQQQQPNSSTAKGGRAARSITALPSFSPRFDVKETETGYELHGELPGVEKEHVNIEFTEPQTLVISGRTERSYTSGTPPSAALLEDTEMSGAITEGNENTNSHKATVEDEDAEKAKEHGGASNSSEVVKHQSNQQQQHQKPKERFWVSERSVGEFSRTFSFPTPVDQEAVSANLKDGILSITVPKARKPEGRRIAVN